MRSSQHNGERVDTLDGKKVKNHQQAGGQKPLVADLDGTLIRTDLMMEGLVKIAAARPYKLFFLAATLVSKGKAAFKARVADLAPIDYATLPFTQEFVAYLKKEKAENRRLYLASAADQRYARGVAGHLNLFDGVFASDGKVNLSGAKKAEALCKAFGKQGFDYAGNDQCDLAVWARANKAVAVNCPPSLRKALGRLHPDHASIAPSSFHFGDYLRAVRVHQWCKNLLLFLPMFAAHAWSLVNIQLLCVAFLSFSLVASGVYVINDLIDLPFDRRHAAKRARPFACGKIPIKNGLLLIPALLLAGLATGAGISAGFAGILCGYFALTLAYSISFKQKPLVDVFVLTGLYSVRVIAGAMAVRVPLSSWFIAFAMFLFLSLALVKRLTELKKYENHARGFAPGRGYRPEDAGFIQTLAGAAGYSSVIVFSLYVNSEAVVLLYRHPKWLWLICMMLLYWISRMLFLASRGHLPDDPVVFTLKDPVSHVIFVLTVAVVFLGRF